MLMLKIHGDDTPLAGPLYQEVNETDPKYGYHQALFPIVQGCVYPDLRKRSAEFIASKGAEGNAIGGLAVGELRKRCMNDRVGK